MSGQKENNFNSTAARALAGMCSGWSLHRLMIDTLSAEGRGPSGTSPSLAMASDPANPPSAANHIGAIVGGE